MAAPPRLPNFQAAWRGRHSVQRMVRPGLGLASSSGGHQELARLESGIACHRRIRSDPRQSTNPVNFQIVCNPSALPPIALFRNGRKAMPDRPSGASEPACSATSRLPPALPRRARSRPQQEQIGSGTSPLGPGHGESVARKGQRPEPAAEDVRFVFERTGWLPFAELARSPRVRGSMVTSCRANRPA